MKRLALLLILPLLVVGSVTAPAQAESASTYSTTAHSATNTARVKDGLRKLTKSRCLATYAARQAAAMAAARELSHQDLGTMLSDCELSGVGENVASGFANGRAVVRGWLASPGHRANILTSGFHEEAIAAVRGSDGRWYVAQDFGR